MSFNKAAGVKLCLGRFLEEEGEAAETTSLKERLDFVAAAAAAATGGAATTGAETTEVSAGAFSALLCLRRRTGSDLAHDSQR